MTKKFLLLASLLYFASCKKTYTCECNTTHVYTDNNGKRVTEVLPGDNSSYSQKMTKSQAESACQHEQTAVQTDLTNGVTGNGSGNTNSQTIAASCSLK